MNLNILPIIVTFFPCPLVLFQILLQLLKVVFYNAVGDLLKKIVIIIEVSVRQSSSVINGLWIKQLVLLKIRVFQDVRQCGPVNSDRNFCGVCVVTLA
jgi:hypothetical protein